MHYIIDIGVSKLQKLAYSLFWKVLGASKEHSRSFFKFGWKWVHHEVFSSFHIADCISSKYRGNLLQALFRLRILLNLRTCLQKNWENSCISLKLILNIQNFCRCQHLSCDKQLRILVDNTTYSYYVHFVYFSMITNYDFMKEILSVFLCT